MAEHRPRKSTRKKSNIGGNTAVEIVRRMRRMEEEMAERGWSVTLAYDLAEEWGCSKDTVYKYRRDLFALMADGLTTMDREKRREYLVGRAERLIEQATVKGQLGPAAGALNVLVGLAGLRDVSDLDAAKDDGPSGPDFQIVAPEVET